MCTPHVVSQLVVSTLSLPSSSLLPLLVLYELLCVHTSVCGPSRGSAEQAGFGLCWQLHLCLPAKGHGRFGQGPEAGLLLHVGRHAGACHPARQRLVGSCTICLRPSCRPYALLRLLLPIALHPHFPCPPSVPALQPYRLIDHSPLGLFLGAGMALPLILNWLMRSIYASECVGE